MAAMARQENHLHAAQSAKTQLIRGRTKGGLDAQLLDVLQPLHRVEPTAAQDPKAGLAEIDGLGDGHHH